MKPDELAERIRTEVGDDPNVGEIRMFGGICFTLNGNMMAGTMKDGTLLVRVGEAREAAALARPGATPMNFAGRTMKGFVIVPAEALGGDALREWIAMAFAHVGPMPPKQKKPKAKAGRKPSPPA